MAKKQIKTEKDIPVNLKDHTFYGLPLDDEQIKFRDAIWSDDYDIVFCEAKSGSGKTTIAVATAMLMYEYGLIDSIVYMSAAGVHEYKQGLLPGTIEEKSSLLFIPLKQALVKIGYDPEHVMCSDLNIVAQKNGSACVLAQTDSYVRGINIGDAEHRVLLIVDETQNFDRKALRSVLSRTGENSKTVVIGSESQCDLKYPQDSAFSRAINLYNLAPRCKICNLSKCYRSWVAELADEI